ncbi:signal peptidase [bacterium]|nr:signal peptidase [bacterium]
MPGDYIVRYGSTRNVAEFSFKGPQDLKRDDAVLIRSNRGTEWGEVLCPATDRTREYMGTQEQVGRILRAADEEAWQQLDDVRARERDVFDRGREVIREHKLQMTLVDVECMFGGERIIFYYLAEQRIDFRELVKDLAKRLQTRIEMRQIGVRDEAKLLADFGDCGKPVCCGTHLREMPPVSMKMAKMQKATLDPNKISGRCGRLKCCLRYEFDTYEEYRRELPNNGAMVVTKQGQGKVIGQEILAQKVLVVFEGGRRMLVDKADIVTVVGRKGGGGSEDSRTRKKRDPDDSSEDGGGNDEGRRRRSDRSKTRSGNGQKAGTESVAVTFEDTSDSADNSVDGGSSSEEAADPTAQ